MKKQAIINLTEYYYSKNEKHLKKFTVILIFFPILLTTFISVLRFTGYVSVMVRTFSNGFTLSTLVNNFLVWSSSFNAISILIQIFKALCFALYVIGVYGIVKYRQPLSFRLILEILRKRVVSAIMLSSLLGITSWLIIKFPLLGGILEIIFSYITIFAMIIYLENSNTIGIVDAIARSIKFTRLNFVNLILLDIYYLFTPTLIGVGIIALSQIIGSLTSLYLLSMFGVFIGSIGICRKLPKAFLGKIIYFLGNPRSH